eukprot:TRINITY_DN50617_c0_g1_i1.p1 TRINITY_DN50617_c0_g1~~TRINITY_DN50617_c0_g1_i1.p1  ORF type:complete len:327 (+),score=41.45 TRINITY_DN50617_c0_g1_i1:123-1103(+)
MSSSETEGTHNIQNLQKQLLDAACTELQARADDLLRSGCEQDLLMLAQNLARAPLPSRWKASQSGFRDQETGNHSMHTPLFPVFVRLSTLSCMARLNAAVARNMAALVRRARDEALQEAEQVYDEGAGLEHATAPLFIAYVSQQLLASSAFPEGTAQRAGTLDSAVEKVRRKLRKKTLHVTRSLPEIPRVHAGALNQESPVNSQRPRLMLPAVKLTRTASETNISEGSRHHTGKLLHQPRLVLTQEDKDYFTAKFLGDVPKASPIHVRARRVPPGPPPLPPGSQSPHKRQHYFPEPSLHRGPERPAPRGEPAAPAFYQPRHVGAQD